MGQEKKNEPNEAVINRQFGPRTDNGPYMNYSSLLNIVAYLYWLLCTCIYNLGLQEFVISITSTYEKY